MSSPLSSEEIRGLKNNRLPEVQRKSNSNSERSSSLEAKKEEKRDLPVCSATDELGKKPSSSNIVVTRKLDKTFKTAGEQKPGVNLAKTSCKQHAKQSMVVKESSPKTTPRGRLFGALQETRKQVRPRIPGKIVAVEKRSEKVETLKDKERLQLALTEKSVKTDACPANLEENEKVEHEHFDSSKDVINEEGLESRGKRDITLTENVEFATVPQQSFVSTENVIHENAEPSIPGNDSVYTEDATVSSIHNGDPDDNKYDVVSRKEEELFEGESDIYTKDVEICAIHNNESDHNEDVIREEASVSFIQNGAETKDVEASKMLDQGFARGEDVINEKKEAFFAEKGSVNKKESDICTVRNVDPDNITEESREEAIEAVLQPKAVQPMEIEESIRLDQTLDLSKDVRLKKEDKSVGEEDCAYGQETLCRASLNEAEEKNEALNIMIPLTNKGDNKLLDQEVSTLKEEVKTCKMEREFGQREILRLKLETQRLASSQKYKERELANLRDNIRRRKQTFIEMVDELDNVKMNNKYLVYHIDTLEKKLKDSEERNEVLQFQLDELNVVMEDLKKTVYEEHDYIYLREEVRLLQGCLKLSKDRERMLERRVEGLEDNGTTSRTDTDFKVTADMSNRELNESKTSEQIKESARLMTELQASAFANTEGKQTEAVRRLENEMESLQLKLREKNDFLAKMEAQFKLKQALFGDTEDKYKATVEKLQNELESLEIKLREKIDAVEKNELLLVDMEAKHKATVKKLHNEIESLEIKLREKNDAIEKNESLLVDKEAKQEETVKKLQNKVESLEMELSKKNDAIEKNESLLVDIETKHDVTVKKLHNELESLEMKLKEKNDAIEKNESLFVDKEAKKEETVKKLHNEIESLEIKLREKIDAIEKNESLFVDKEAKQKETVKKLHNELESLEIKLKEKNDTIEKTKSLLLDMEDKRDETVKKLHNELESLEIKVREKTDAIEKNESLLVDIEAKHDVTVKKLHNELESLQMKLKEKTDAIEKNESLLIDIEAKQEETVNKLHNEIESLEIKLREKIDAIEKNESLLVDMEAKHKATVKKLHNEIESLEIKLREKTDAIEKSESLLIDIEAKQDETVKKLQSALGDKMETEAKYEGIVQQLQSDLKRVQKLLREKQLALDEMEVHLQVKESKLLVLTERLRSTNTHKDLETESVIERLTTDVESLQSSLKEKTTALEKTQFDVQWKTSLLDSMNSKYENTVTDLKDALKRVQNKLKETKFLSAELAQVKKEKERMEEKVVATLMLLEKEKITAKKENRDLQKQINFFREELKARERQILDLKIKLNESRFRLKRLESEKRETEFIEKEFKDNPTRKKKFLQRKLKASDDKKLLEQDINSLTLEKQQLTMENQKLTQRAFCYGDRDVPAGPRMPMLVPSETKGGEIQENTKDVTSEFTSDCVANKDTPRVTSKKRISKKKPGITNRIRGFFTRKKTEKSSVPRQQC